ncbi:endopeptidase La [Miltoncostaea marina]|uniref:endopeptidase La n=1 Tax=Miltoncostaea marina TaxID=2843215 RepID=UPI001C3E85A5|nr:endopeptidase La [Miltoncostaea marina]
MTSDAGRPDEPLVEPGGEAGGPDAETPIPESLAILPLKETVVFPDAVAPLAIGEPRSIRLIDEVLNQPERMLVLVASRDPEATEPPPEQLYEVGTAAIVQRMVRVPDGTVRILAQGLRRVRIGDYTATEPFLQARVDEIVDAAERTTEVEALARNLQSLFTRMIDLVPHLPDELGVAVTNIEDPTTLSFLIASSIRLTLPERQELLEETDLAARLRRLTALCSRELELLELGAKIQSDVQTDMEKSQREYFLRQQLKAIRQELGEGGEGGEEVEQLRERLDEVAPPEEIRTAAERELSRLERLPPESAEHNVVRTYLDWILSIPWGTATEDDLDLERARRILDEDHYDIEKVKDRIIEQLAVARLKPDAAGPILCFVGPPGVGKTSVGQSIARALGRRFARISVGGVRDESEIRGHRRTYVGAMPGTIVRAIRDAGAMNPVLMVDEIDKMGSDVRGDPSSAMLEVLDPAQNSTFRDHYLDLPLDLSRVLFLCTANVLETIPGPLLDRMEVIRLSGYTEEEKLHIARRYLLPRQLDAAGLPEGTLEVTDDGLLTIIGEYTREAGVRQLERRIGAVARRTARRVAEGDASPRTAGPAEVREILGPERIHNEVKRRTSEPGVATGLAVTGAGGEILFVEATVMPGGGKLTVTGQLGDVMRESAQAAVSFVRARAGALDLDLADDFFATHDIHLHVPAGAVPKDGPSAGVTMVTALVSALSGRPVSEDVAMTGEITLTGQVLPIGGVKEKVLAAHRAGIRGVVLPKLNEDGLAELPAGLADEMRITLADRIEQVLATALDGAAPDGADAAPSERS